MTLSSRTSRLGPLFALGFVLLSCDSQTEIQSTVPRNKESNVDPRSIVAVRLSNTIGADDTQTLDPANFIVTGDLSSEPYTGTLSTAKWSLISPGMTVEEFQKSGAANAAAQTEEPKDEAETKDTVVFLLPQGKQFKEGETIQVFVKHDVTASKSVVKKSKKFSFSVRGGSSSSGDLQVASTSPAAYQAAVPAGSRIHVTFTSAVKSDGLQDATSVQGSQSGLHEGQMTLVGSAGATSGAEATFRLAAGDSFLPGERVTVTLASGITKAGSTTPATAQKLRPYHLEFQVQPGHPAGGWTAPIVVEATEAPITVIAADFRPQVDGVEFVLAGEHSLTLFSKGVGSTWTRLETTVPSGDAEDPFAVADAAVYPMGDAGTPGVVVLLGRSGGSRLQAYDVGTSGQLKVSGKPVDFPGVLSSPAQGLRSLAALDLDSSGKPEVLVLHQSRKYVPESGQPAVDTGYLTIFEFALIPPDPDTINPADPSTLESTPGFVAVDYTIQKFELSSRLEGADFNGDGRIDLLAETASGIRLFQNFGTAETKYACRLAGTLPGRAGGVLAPIHWTVGDLDGDRRPDVLAWDSQGAVVYGGKEISEALSSTDPAAALAESVRPEPLAIELPAPSLAQVVELSGDVSRDLALLGDGHSRILLAKPSQPFEYDVLDLQGMTSPAALAVADLDGDTGLDLAVAVPSLKGAALYLSSEVEAPPAGSRTSFHFGAAQTVQEKNLRIPLLGDFAEEFTGYSVAMVLTEGVLKYKGFEPPAAFAGQKFEVWPTGEGAGKSAAARMTYQQGGKGGSKDDVPLGTFLFEKPEVKDPVTVTFELKSFTGTDSKAYDNTVTVVEGSGSLELPATIEGDPLKVKLDPPPPPPLADLKAECVVLERLAQSLKTRVSWSSPSGLRCFKYEISDGGDGSQLVDGVETSAVFVTQRTGEVTITVNGLDAAEKVLASSSCNVVAVHQVVEVACVPLALRENRITWTPSHGVDKYAIYRNGRSVGQTPDGQTTYFIDTQAEANVANNYHVAGWIGSIEGPRASCKDGPIGGSASGTVAAPSIVEAVLASRMLPSDPNILRLRWVNGEGYDLVRVDLARVGESAPFLTQEVRDGRTEITYDAGDRGRGGASPGEYVFSLIGKVKDKQSDTVRSSTVRVPVPPLNVPLDCETDGLGNFLVSWDRTPWGGYSSLRLFVERTEGGVTEPVGEPVELSRQDTGYTVRDIAPGGTYEARLVAAYVENVADGLLPPPDKLQSSCQTTLEPRIFIGTIETGVGLSGIEVPIQCEAPGPIHGFHFELEYPSFLEIDSVDAGPGAEVDWQIPDDPSSDGKLKLVVTVSGVEALPDADGDGTPDGPKVLATLVCRVPPDFSHGAIDPPWDLAFGKDRNWLENEDLGQFKVAAEDGKLVVARRYIAIDQATVAAGSREVIPLAVWTSFDARQSAYRLSTIQIHIKWDPALLELQPVTEEDQMGTVLYGKGFSQYATDAAFISLRDKGEFRFGWLSFDFTHPARPPSFLDPGLHLKLLQLKFISKVAAGSPETLVRVDFIKPPSTDLPTAFFPEVDDPTEPEIEVFAPGGVRASSPVVPLAAGDMTPGEGALAGGNEAEITGSGFGAAEGLSLKLLPLDPDADPIQIGDILSVISNRVRFKLPPLVPADSSRLSFPMDLEVVSGERSAVLPNAYTYRYPRLVGSDIKSGYARGGEVMTLNGEGLPVSARVKFVVSGGVSRDAGIKEVSPDGKSILVLTPELKGFAGSLATIEVSVPIPGEASSTLLVLPEAYTILPDPGVEGELKLTGVTPVRGSICGGETITLKGQGFQQGMTVTFVTVASKRFDATSVQVTSGTAATATTPPMPEGTRTVTVEVSTGSGSRSSLAGAFTFDPVVFLRGDLDDSGGLNILDLNILSLLIRGTVPDSFSGNQDAADVNDDGKVDITDLTLLAGYFSWEGNDPAPPFPAPGVDPTPDSLKSCR